MLENIDRSSTETMKAVKSETNAPSGNSYNYSYSPVNTKLPVAAAVDKNTSAQKSGKAAPELRLSKSMQAEVRKLQMQCRQLCVSMFFDERVAVRSVGFTSAIAGEGKSYLARMAAIVMATDLNIPVTLLECNWEHPCFDDLFSLQPGPGLAEWLRGECKLEAIRQPVSGNLTVIRAGDGKHDTVRLLKYLRKRGVLGLLDRPDEVLIVDLPSLVTVAYGRLAASIAESLIMVVRMGVTPDSFVSEATTYLKDLRVQGMVLNQAKRRMPRWLEEIL